MQVSTTAGKASFYRVGFTYPELMKLKLQASSLEKTLQRPERGLSNVFSRLRIPIKFAREVFTIKMSFSFHSHFPSTALPLVSGGASHSGPRRGPAEAGELVRRSV